MRTILRASLLVSLLVPLLAIGACGGDDAATNSRTCGPSGDCAGPKCGSACCLAGEACVDGACQCGSPGTACTSPEVCGGVPSAGDNGCGDYCCTLCPG